MRGGHQAGRVQRRRVRKAGGCRGLPRMTLDADVTVNAEIEALPGLLAAAAAAGFAPRPEDPAAFVRETRVLPLRRIADGWQVDLISAGTYCEREAIARATTVRVAGIPLPIVTAEDLLVHNVLAGRPKDLEDAATIATRYAGRLDRGFVRGVILELADALADDELRRRVEQLLPG